jgi:UDP-2-acetamido-2-deoxy-ribo-hexuluronate aminotransferase
MKIDFAKLQDQYQLYKEEIDQAIHNVLNKSNYIMGEEIVWLEQSLQEFTKAQHAITCSSGTDALLLSMMALSIQPRDEVITTPFTFISTAETIALLGARPVFVDIDDRTYNIDINKIEKKITPKTRAIIPVSLYGQPADIQAIQSIADKYDIKVIVDGAQSFGSTYRDITDSCLGDLSCTSFFPAKPLGCFGDGGAIFTDDEKLATKIQQLRVHGQSRRYHHKYIGLGGRLDTLQAAVLNVKLKYYQQDLLSRQTVASKYTTALRNKDIILPFIDPRAQSTWAQYSIRTKHREKLQIQLKDAGVPTAVHYPIPLHLQECFRYLNYQQGDFPIAENVADEIMSLPMNPYLTDQEIHYICGLL